MGVFPPTGLEYIAASMEDLVGRITLLDLRYEKAYRDPGVLGAFIRDEVDLLCISIGWQSQFEKVCDFISQLPPEVTTVVGGHKATGLRPQFWDKARYFGLERQLAEALGMGGM